MFGGHPRLRPSLSGPSEVAMVTTGPAESAYEHRLQIYLTDMISPGRNTVARVRMEDNMNELRELGCTQQEQVEQNVSAMNIPTHLKSGTKVFLAGSPADHDPDGHRRGNQCGGNIKFKEDIFFQCAGTRHMTQHV